MILTKDLKYMYDIIEYTILHIIYFIIYFKIQYIYINYHIYAIVHYTTLYYNLRWYAIL